MIGTTAGRVILPLVNRRLRLALLLAALVAAGPMPSARTIDAARADVSIAWFRSDRASRLQVKHHAAAVLGATVARVAFSAPSDPALPRTLRSHSLYQRPPPLQH